LVKAQVTCCNQKNYTFDISNYWSRPLQLTDGDPTGIHLTGTAAYDFNTSLVTSQTDPNNLTTSYSYDGALRLQQKTLPTGASVTTTYNDAALTASSTMTYVEAGQNRSITSSAVYNGWGQATQKLDAASNQVNIAYDSMQRVCAQTNPFAQGGQTGPSTTYSYDGLGRVRVTTLPDTVNTIQYTYSGNTRTITDQVNRQIKQEQDGLGRIVKVTEKDANGQLTQETNYTYNVIDKLTDVNQGGQLRAFKYDALGRLLFERIPEQSATIDDGTGTFWSSKNTWTDFHAISTRQDARGAVTSYGYDVLNRLTSVTYDISNAPGVASTPNVTYSYDTSSFSSTKGLLLSVTVGAFYSESYGFDSQNRVSSVTQTIDGRGYTTSYQFNTASQHTQITYPSGRVININHGNMGRLSSLADGAGPIYVNSVTYNAAEQVTGFTLGNGVTESFGYDPNRLLLVSQTATASGGPTGGLINLNYHYDASAGQNGTGTTAGNAAKLMSVSGTINGTTESANYTYDLLNRLATSSQTTNGVSAQRRFAFDRLGNRTGVWDAVTGGNQIQTVTLEQSAGVPTNRIATVNGVGYSYDPAGNVTNDGSHSYVYDAENRVTSVDGSAAAYSYDHRNWRVKKVVGSSITHYVWEAGRVLAEHNGSNGTAIVDYIRLAGAMVAKVQSGSTQYLLSDRQSVRMTLDSSGNVIGRQAHLAFGEDFAESGTQEKHHFTSYERDAESGQDYAVNRFHNFNVGRFTSADRVTGTPANPQSWNRYSYGMNDPVNRSDQAGLDDDELPFYELSLDDIFALVDGGGGGGGGDYGLSEFLDVFGGGDDAFIEPIGPDPSLLRPILGQESIDISAGDSSIQPFSSGGLGFSGQGVGGTIGEADPAASQSGSWEETLRNLQKIAKKLGGRIYIDPSDNVTYIIDVHMSYNEVVEKLKSMGFSWFLDLLPTHFGGSDYAATEPPWYHVTVGYPYGTVTVTLPRGFPIEQERFRPDLTPPWITIHIDPNDPTSFKHFWNDVLKRP
jgi:RHS repeat-associated protein